MGLNEFPPLLGEGLMIKALPGLTAAVGSFVRAYGNWLTTVPERFTLALLPLELAHGLFQELRAGVRVQAGMWVLAGEHRERVGRPGVVVFWHLLTAIIDAGEAQLTQNLYRFAVGKAKAVLVNKVSCSPSHSDANVPGMCGLRHSAFSVTAFIFLLM